MKKILLIAVGLFLAGSVAPQLWARQVRLWSQAELYGDRLLDLSDGWATPLGKRVSFPWRVEGVPDASFHKTLPAIPDSLFQGLDAGDSLYLWIEQVSWEAELVINQQYWGVRECRGGAWVVPIPVEVWASGALEMVLTVRQTTPVPFSPPMDLYVNPPICLLTREQLDEFRPKSPEVVEAAEEIAIVPAYYRAMGWEFDGFEALRTLQPVLDLRMKVVYFPFPPDRRMQMLCAYYGLKQVRELPPKARVIWTAWYPQAPGMMPLPEAWWLDDEASRTQFYGTWLSMNQLVQIPGEPSGRENVVYILLGILLFLLFLKMTFPGMFGMQFNWLWPAGRSVGNIDPASALPGPLWLWMATRWIMWSLVLGMIALMLRDQGLWLQVRPATTQGIAWHWLSEATGLPGMILRSISVLIVVDMFRYLLAAGAGVAFSVPRFVQAVIRLDLMATFPLVYVLGLPWAASVLYPQYGGIAVWIGGSLMVLHVIRLSISSAAGLQQFYSFSGGLIFLYICSLNLIPYLLLW